ncbi:hypothetical protein [Roseovarius sp.]|uniref:hypothetical protein n=1 Tax=Roseovarius sp. TaxID=1486281 RepID=UPI002580D3B9|nr:hypothetical protein [Roseovarius sp.]
MVSTSKILTVSYGTFSCTLEGFDDSFDTMKAIAEYFRDLAADDRYFGAEPPTPDAEMLARIAEREISRRVEARDDEGRIHLRAAQAEQAEAAAQPAPQLTSQTPSAPAVEPTPAPAPAPAAAMETPAPVAPVAPAPEPFTAAQPTPDYEAEPVTSTPRDIDRAAPAEAESVADKLRRIRAVASPQSVAFAETYNEDEHAQDFMQSTAPEAEPEAAPESVTPAAETVAETVAEPETAGEISEAFADDTAEDLADETPVDVTEDVLAALAADDSAEKAAELYDDEDEDALYTSGAEAEDTLAQLMADAASQDDITAAEDNAAEDSAEEDSAELGDSLASLLADDKAEEAADDDAETLEDVSPVRVVKVKRSEFDSVFEDAEEVATDETAEDSAEALDPDAEAELLRELAAVEAEFNGHDESADALAMDDLDDDLEDDLDDEDTAEAARADDDETAEDEAQDVSEDDIAAPRPSRLAAQADTAETDRMFREADTQLDDSEGSKRRSAIQHLRAAVAATKAEKSAGIDITPRTDAAPYHMDLEQAVRPRRPRADGEARTDRPEVSRPAPLRLVAEQRVDTPSEPVRPRRVSQAELVSDTLDGPVPSTDGGFADYAEKVGADNLTELLEAAAAYISDVEGREQFSRPMLMHKLREVDDSGFSREDGLRSFGQLLRQGKLQKVKGGRFTVTDVTDFRRAG